ncbi:unnamed protein product [Rhizopus stolonifer]
MSNLKRWGVKEFYIELSEERYYFPGEEIKGQLVLNLKRRTKTVNFEIILSCLAEMKGSKRKTDLTLKIIPEKANHLNRGIHRYPFSMMIPTDLILPSTLEIPGVLKVSYRLKAIYNGNFSLLKNVYPTARKSVAILEDINVESDRFNGPHTLTKDRALAGESRNVRVEMTLPRLAAVKGDTIPITIKIHHIGVMVRNRAIKVQLMKYVHDKNGKIHRIMEQSHSVADIEILGPTKFTESFHLPLPIISASTCPTVKDSCEIFKIEYHIQATINLNEENPHGEEKPANIFLLDQPFTVGTRPRNHYAIDPDDNIGISQSQMSANNIRDDKNEESIQSHLSEDSVHDNQEYDKVVEGMKHVELDTTEQRNSAKQQDPDARSIHKPDSLDSPDTLPVSTRQSSKSQETPPTTPTKYTNAQAPGGTPRTRHNLAPIETNHSAMSFKSTYSTTTPPVFWHTGSRELLSSRSPTSSTYGQGPMQRTYKGDENDSLISPPSSAHTTEHMPWPNTEASSPTLTESPIYPVHKQDPMLKVPDPKNSGPVLWVVDEGYKRTPYGPYPAFNHSSPQLSSTNYPAFPSPRPNLYPPSITPYDHHSSNMVYSHCHIHYLPPKHGNQHYTQSDQDFQRRYAHHRNVSYDTYLEDVDFPSPSASQSHQIPYRSDL